MFLPKSGLNLSFGHLLMDFRGEHFKQKLKIVRGQQNLGSGQIISNIFGLGSNCLGVPYGRECVYCGKARTPFGIHDILFVLLNI